MTVRRRIARAAVVVAALACTLAPAVLQAAQGEAASTSAGALACVPPTRLHRLKHTLLGLNWWAWDSHRPPMGWFLLDFALFVLGLVLVARGPLGRAFRARHKSIRKAVTDAAASHAKASDAQQAWARRLGGLDAEARELEAQSVRDGEAERSQMVVDAEARAAQMRRDAEIQAEQETKRAYERLRQRLLAEALALAERRMRESLTPDDQARLLDEAIAGLATASSGLDAGTEVQR